jgi:hypothetical protein
MSLYSASTARDMASRPRLGVGYLLPAHLCPALVHPETLLPCRTVHLLFHPSSPTMSAAGTPVPSPSPEVLPLTSLLARPLLQDPKFILALLAVLVAAVLFRREHNDR